MKCSEGDEPKEKKFAEVAAASFLVVAGKWLLEALAGFLCFKFFDTLWKKYIRKWWNKLWKIEEKSDDEE
jgi:hypothetical protein